MKAIYIKEHATVSDLKVSDVPTPLLGSDQVLVRVEASGINPSDVASVEGKFPNAVLPGVVGRDFAGTVVNGSGLDANPACVIYTMQKHGNRFLSEVFIHSLPAAVPVTIIIY